MSDRELLLSIHSTVLRITNQLDNLNGRLFKILEGREDIGKAVRSEGREDIGKAVRSKDKNL